MTEIRMSIKTRRNGVWRDVMAGPFAGKTLREMFTMMQGTDTLCRYEGPDGKGYFCGTEDLLKLLHERGDRAYLFAEAIQKIAEGRNASILDEIAVPEEMAALGANGISLEEYIFYPQEDV